VNDESRRRGSPTAVTAVGLLLGAVAMVFVTRTLARDWDEITAALDDAEVGWVALGWVLAAVGMIAIAVPWRFALRLVGGDLSAGQVVARYFVGEIGKYVPGGVWPVVGRGELARRGGVRRTEAYGSVALSLATLYLAAMLVVFIGTPLLLSGDDGTGAVAVVVLLPLGIAALHPAVLGKVVDLLERVSGRRVDLALPPWRSVLALVVSYVPAWLAIGIATWAVARSLDPGADLAELAVAAILSWVVGFVLVPVPGGVGVREAAFVAAAGSLDPGIAAATAVAARALFISVDVLGAVLGAAVLRARSERAPELSADA
jgi:uncharacterized membrane protein YbhN (UPF0104 family)